MLASDRPHRRQTVNTERYSCTRNPVALLLLSYDRSAKAGIHRSVDISRFVRIGSAPSCSAVRDEFRLLESFSERVSLGSDRPRHHRTHS